MRCSLHTSPKMQFFPFPFPFFMSSRVPDCLGWLRCREPQMTQRAAGHIGQPNQRGPVTGSDRLLMAQARQRYLGSCGKHVKRRGRRKEKRVEARQLLCSSRRSISWQTSRVCEGKGRRGKRKEKEEEEGRGRTRQTQQFINLSHNCATNHLDD